MWGSTEILLLLRARDEASRVLAGLSGTMRTMSKEQKAAIASTMARGRALVGLGVGIGAIGAAGLVFYANATQAAIAYDQQAALTLTQLDKVHGSLNDLKKIGREVGAEIPVDFAQIQPALYDIFSSMDTNLAGAKVLLTSFSKSAVAGQVNLQDSARATIGILNAFHMKVKQVSMVQDVMFQLVRKGVGTYAQFAETIGRATPSASKAGQSIQTLAGMLAFLTRNGLSAAMASASAARALDAIANPKTQQNFKAMGMSLIGANGQFKSMGDIMTMLQGKLGKLTAPQRAKALHQLFQGSGGTIQAMRFFNIATKNSAQLNSLVKDMVNSKGAMQGAYNIMFKQPQTQVQLLKNNMAILKTEVGDMLVPAFQRLTGWLINVVKWFNNLNPGVKKAIVIIGLIISVFLVLVGVVVIVAGVFLMLSAAVAAAGGMAVIGPIIGIIAAVIAALIVVIVVLWKWHKQIWAFMVMVWKAISNAVVAAWQAIWHAIGPTVIAIYTFIINTFTAIWNFIVTTFIAIYNAVKGPIMMIWQITMIVLQAVWAVYTTYLGLILTIVKGVLSIVYTIWKTYLTFVWTIVSAVFKLIWAVIYLYIGMIWTIIKTTWNLIVAATKTAWNSWNDTIGRVIRFVYNNIVKPVISAIYNYIKGHWDTIKAVTQTAWGFIKGAIIQPIEDAYNGVVTWVDKIIEKIGSIAGKIAAPIKAVTGLLNKLNPLNRNSPSIVDKTIDGWTAMDKVYKAGMAQVRQTASESVNVKQTMMAAANGSYAGSNYRVQPNTTPSSGPNISQTFNITTQEIDPTKHAADLGWSIGRRMS